LATVRRESCRGASRGACAGSSPARRCAGPRRRPERPAGAPRRRRTRAPRRSSPAARSRRCRRDRRARAPPAIARSPRAAVGGRAKSPLQARPRPGVGAIRGPPVPPRATKVPRPTCARSQPRSASDW
jgi:hypothetical protein